MVVVGRLFTVALLFVACVALGSAPVAAQNSSTPVMLKDGRSFFADKVEMLGDKVVLHPRGGTPIEVPFAGISCIGAACGTAAPPTAACAATPGKIGLHGSNTIGASLMPALIDSYAKSLPSGSTDKQFGGADKQTIKIMSGGAEKATIDLQATGSGDGFKGLLACTAQIGMSSRQIKPQEATDLRTKYNVDMLAPDSEHVLALDGVAVIVNSANPLKDVAMNLELIAKIFSGEISDWGQLGGTPGPIKVMARDEKSGTFGTFDDLVLKPQKKTLVATATRFENSDELSDGVAKNAMAIGFIGLPYIANNKPITIGSTCGIQQSPSRYNIQSEVYPLSRRLFLYTIGAPADPTVRELIAFALSDPAQAVIHGEKFIDQTIEFQEPAAQDAWAQSVASLVDRKVPSEFAKYFDQLQRTAKRASVQFRFAKNSDELDNKALLDAARLARLLRQPAVAGKQWALIGFADNDGSFRQNAKLAMRRAQAVADILRRDGIAVTDNNLATLSYMAPVGCNDSDQGKALNRRVELWVER